jgi:hypothetical protein
MSSDEKGGFMFRELETHPKNARGSKSSERFVFHELETHPKNAKGSKSFDAKKASRFTN